MHRKLFILSISLVFTLQLSAQTVFKSEEVVLETTGTRIHGTLLSPESKKKPPVVLIIAGSGPTDRDGNNPVMKNNSLKMLSEALYAEGIASLRYDKRTIAGSADTTIKEDDLRFNHLIDDATAWINLLRARGQFSRIIVAGHSEGSLIGMVAAQKAGADAFISLAGAGEAADKTLRRQLATQPEFVTDAAYPILDSLVAGKMVTEVPPYLGPLFRASVQPYIISWFQYDPQKEIAKIKKPVLIVQGTTDIQVSVEDAKNLATAQPRAKLVVIEGMNHIFKAAEADQKKNIATYNKPDLPLVPELTAAVVKFVKKGK